MSRGFLCYSFCRKSTTRNLGVERYPATEERTMGEGQLKLIKFVAGTIHLMEWVLIVLSVVMFFTWKEHRIWVWVLAVIFIIVNFFRSSAVEEAEKMVAEQSGR
jgi:hypothetical protein